MEKECHMRKVRPTENFFVKPTSGDEIMNYHMEGKSGTNEWVKVPGKLWTMIGYAEKLYKDIDNVIHDINDYVPANRYILKERINRLKHKLYGIRYHLENFLDEENKTIEKYKSQYHAPNTESTFHNPRLI